MGRRLSPWLLLAGALLPGPGRAAPHADTDATLIDAERKVARAYAQAQEKLGAWCLESGLREEGRGALEEACHWDALNEQAARMLAALPSGPPPPSDEAARQEHHLRAASLVREQSKAFANLAQRALKAKAWGMAHRLAGKAHRLHAEGPELAEIEKTLNGQEGQAALQPLRTQAQEARQGDFIFPGEKGKMAYLFKLPHDYAPVSRPPLYIFIHGAGGDIREWSSGHEPYRESGYAVLLPEILSSKNEADPSLESREVWRIVDQLTVAFGIDPDRVFLTGHSGGGRMAYTMLNEYRDRLRGVVALEANFCVGVRPCPKENPFPVLLVRGEKDPFNASLLDGQLASATAALRRAKFTNLRFETVPGMTHDNLYLAAPVITSWCRDLLALKQGGR